MTPLFLISAARYLAYYEGEKDFLPRAVSTYYYALFRAICIGIADEWFGADELSRSSVDWNHMCRGVNHGAILRACKDKNLISRLPIIFGDLAEIFQQAQLDRHLADYDLLNTFERELVLKEIDKTERVILGFDAAESIHRRIFLSRIVYPDRK